MKIVGLIPFWFGNNDSRDLKKLAGKYLIEYTVELLNSIDEIKDTLIYSSNTEILKYINEDLVVKHIQRPKKLDDSNILIEDIIEQFFIDYNDVDVMVLIHPLCPFIQKSTIEDCLLNMKSRKFDSSFTALEYQKFAWFESKPLNFNKEFPSPKLNSVEPIIIEQGLTYIISKEVFLKNRNRIGTKPFVKIINHFEGHEINEVKDFEIAELIVNSGMYQGV